MKYIKKFISTILLYISKGLNFWCTIFSKGFFFYLLLPFFILKKIFKKSSFFDKIVNYLKFLQNNPLSFISFLLIFGIMFYYFNYLFNDNSITIKLDNNTEEIVVNSDENNEIISEKKISKNTFKYYESMKLNEIDFKFLNEINNDIVAWISVDHTNINYPVTQSGDNEFYLNHGIDKSSSTNGWPFMDYRNSKILSDSNTIFYGHNLKNGHNFSSITNMFSDEWFYNSNHNIIVLFENKKYKYQIFSQYISEADDYYLQNNFDSSDDFSRFLNNIKDKSIYNFNVEVSAFDKIITLSTCTSDNVKRQVIHAKLVSE